MIEVEVSAEEAAALEQLQRDGVVELDLLVEPGAKALARVKS